MKTRPYDPDLDGDGRSRMVSMEVEPPEGSVVEFRDKSGRFVQGPYHISSIQWRWHQLVSVGKRKSAAFWTFAPRPPVKPELVKSYAGLCVHDGMIVGGLCEKRDNVISPSLIAEYADTGLAVIHFIFDHLPDEHQAEILALLQDALDGEGG